MPATTDIDTTQNRLHRLLQKAIPATEQQSRPGKIIPALLIISLPGTRISFQTSMAFFSLSFVTIASLSLILIWKNQPRISKYLTIIIATLTVTSVLSRCSPAFTFQTTRELLKIFHDKDYQVYTLRKIDVFNLGLDQATVQTAQTRGTYFVTTY